MPNHFHGIIIIGPVGAVGADLRVCLEQSGRSEQSDAQGAHIGAPLPKIIQWFETMTTNEYIRAVKTSGWPGFRGQLWQRNYYEHITRNEESLNLIREYILTNPMRWTLDRENPYRGGVDEFEKWLDRFGNKDRKREFYSKKTERTLFGDEETERREAARSVEEELNPGEHTVVFSAKELPTGVYFYRLITQKFSQTKAMEVMK